MANISTGVVFSENPLICSGGMKRRIEPVTHPPPPRACLVSHQLRRIGAGKDRGWGHALGVAAGEEGRGRL